MRFSVLQLESDSSFPVELYDLCDIVSAIAIRQKNPHLTLNSGLSI